MGRARLGGAFGIGFDFLNLPVYPAAVAVSCAWVAQPFLLLGSGAEARPKVSFFCTLLKLALLILGPAYAALGGLALLKSGR
jgi:hypothetical protein